MGLAFCNLGTKMSVDRYQTCLICRYFSSKFFKKSYKMSVAKVKVAQNRHVCDQSARKLQAMLYRYCMFIQFWVR